MPRDVGAVHPITDEQRALAERAIPKFALDEHEAEMFLDMLLGDEEQDAVAS